jgi:gamma-glutamyltranspeptidase
VNAVATPHAAATEAATATFASGGNAVDAALAAAAVLTVVFPHNCAIGGDLIALVRRPGLPVTCVNASGPAARGVDADALRARGTVMPTTGTDPITGPGLVAGWDRIHALGASLPWPDLLAPAVAVAREGFPVSRSLAAAVVAASERLAADPGTRATFMPAGAPPRSGHVLRQPQLAATLAEIARVGAGALYGGTVGRVLTGGLARLGSPLRVSDLAAFEPELTEPLRGRYGGVEVLTSGANTAGVALLRALAVIEALALDGPLGRDAGILARALVHALEDHDRAVGDPRAGGADVAAWLEPEAIADLAARATGVTTGGVRTVARASGDTVGIVTADADGAAVSLIQSLFHGFGAMVLEPATGILMHNRGTSFSLEPDHPNALAPGKRPSHTLMPVMVERDGDLAAVLGTMGGRAQPQIHAQVLLRLLGGAAAPDAVAAPRWIAGPMERDDTAATARIERDVPAVTRNALTAAGLAASPLGRHDEYAGHANAIVLPPLTGGLLSAGSDPRADGAAMAADFSE